MNPMRALALVLIWLIVGQSAAAVAAPDVAERDRETQALESRVADDPRAALDEAAAMHERATKAADRGGQLKAMRLKVLALLQLQDTQRLIEAANSGLPLAREVGDPQAECEFLVAQGAKLSSEGKFQEAGILYDQAIALATRNGLVRTVTSIQVTKAYDLSLLGRDADALDLLSKAHQKFLDLGDAASARLALAAIGNAYFQDRATPDDLRKAASFHERSIPPDAEHHRRHELATSYANLGAVYHRLKELPKARDYLKRSIALYKVLNDPIGQAFGAYRMGLVYADEKQWREALDQQEKAFPAFDASGETVMRFNVLRARARALAELDRRRESIDALKGAEAISEKSESAWLESTYLASAAEVQARLGDYEQAYKSLLALREADQALANEAREKEEKEYKNRFDLKQKDAENELLRARARESDARRWILVLVVALMAIVVGGLAWYLVRQNQQNRRFADLALRDDLTGLPNRRSILEFARGQHRAAVSENQKLVIAVIDLDHFKSINDRFGHATGDRVLVAFAALCQQQLRSIDRIGRYGGEEFMLVMPGSELAQVPQVFTRLRLAMRHLVADGYANAEQITFSMGASEVKSMSDDLDAVIKRADDALYRAKQGGRDRHEIA